MKRKIVKIPQKEFINKLKETKLKGYNGEKVYKNSQINLLYSIDPIRLHPCQTYVMKDKLKLIMDLYYEMLQYDINIFQLESLIYIDGVPFSPPIIEADPETKTEFLINDGMHRIYAALKLKVRINIIYVQFVDPNYPYYAFPLPRKWENVQEIEELTSEFKRKRYRDPDNYKMLFRNFNELFPGIQTKRNNK